MRSIERNESIRSKRSNIICMLESRIEKRWMLHVYRFKYELWWHDTEWELLSSLSSLFLSSFLSTHLSLFAFSFLDFFWNWDGFCFYILFLGGGSLWEFCSFGGGILTGGGIRCSLFLCYLSVLVYLVDGFGIHLMDAGWRENFGVGNAPERNFFLTVF